MTYEEVLNYIHSFSLFSRKPGLDRMRYLMNKLGNPQDSLKFIHIAGTNGKGSIAAMLASILTQGGLKTGMFTSPYLIDFRERMQIDFFMIPKDQLIRLCERVKKEVEKCALEGVEVTEFELITAIGFLWFYKNQCDMVVLETGLGGRIDATNVIQKPLVSVITSISLDHTQVLGEHISQIAGEKCGIIKKQGRTVSYPMQEQAALEVIRKYANKQNNTLYMGNIKEVSILKCDLEGSVIKYKKATYEIPLVGEHQIFNALTAIETIKALKEYDISDEDIALGIKNTKWPGRIEVVAKKPYIIIDGSHNLSGIQALATVAKKFPPEKVTVIFGMLADKDYLGSLHTLAAHCKNLLLITPNHPRALPHKKLMQEAEKIEGLKVQGFDTFDEALDFGIREGDKEGVLIICGSLYIVGDVKKSVEKYLVNLPK